MSSSAKKVKSSIARAMELGGVEGMNNRMRRNNFLDKGLPESDIASYENTENIVKEFFSAPLTGYPVTLNAPIGLVHTGAVSTNPLLLGSGITNKKTEALRNAFKLKT